MYTFVFTGDEACNSKKICCLLEYAINSFKESFVAAQVADIARNLKKGVQPSKSKGGFMTVIKG